MGGKLSSASRFCLYLRRRQPHHPPVHLLSRTWTGSPGPSLSGFPSPHPTSRGPLWPMGLALHVDPVPPQLGPWASDTGQKPICEGHSPKSHVAFPRLSPEAAVCTPSGASQERAPCSPRAPGAPWRGGGGGPGFIRNNLGNYRPTTVCPHSAGPCSLHFHSVSPPRFDDNSTK